MPAGTTSIRVVQRNHVERRVRHAIARRFGHPAPDAVLSVKRDRFRRAVVLHMNSGGNALTAESALRGAGYEVEPLGAAPSGHGVLLRVLPSSPR